MLFIASLQLCFHSCVHCSPPCSILPFLSTAAFMSRSFLLSLRQTTSSLFSFLLRFLFCRVLTVHLCYNFLLLASCLIMSHSDKSKIKSRWQDTFKTEKLHSWLLCAALHWFNWRGVVLKVHRWYQASPPSPSFPVGCFWKLSSSYCYGNEYSSFKIGTLLIGHNDTYK